MTEFYTRFRKNSASLEILGDSATDNNEYFVEFIDIKTNVVEYSIFMKVNYITKIEYSSDKDITIKVSLNNQVVFERNQSYKFNKVYVKIASSSLGDTIGWIPYVEEYRKVHNVDVILFTSHNYLFDKVYDKIEFTDISDDKYFKNVDKKFRIDYGPYLSVVNNQYDSKLWFEENKEFDNCIDFVDYRTTSLQGVSSSILGLPNVEIKTKVNISEDNGPRIKGKYVVVAIQSTSQLKYWNNPFGWSSVFDFLGRNGYKIVLIDRYKSYGVINHFNQAPKSKYVIDKTGDYPLSDRIIDIKYADMMITISSGLAWLAWAIETPVIMISGFTKPFCEFQSNIIRLHNSTVCNGCWNDTNVRLNMMDWMCCPKNNDFVCSKAIQPKDVTDAIKKLMK